MLNFFHPLLILSLFLTLPTALSLADTDSAKEAEGVNATPTLTRRGHGMGMKFNKGGTSKTPGAIKGYCTIVASPSNPIAGSCVSIMLILKEADGTEAEKNRTSPQGQFSFLGQAGKTYTIESGSKFYESVKAKNLIYPGDTVNVFLKQK